jgi:uncharacterized repeat protein (TIGR03803 family)
LTLLADGGFYGTTTSGGANNLGTVFRVTSEGVQTVLHSFTAGPDGHTPVAGLSSASDGYLYGVTYYGGTNDFGTIFRIAPNGTGYATLHSFAGGVADGQYPGTKLRNVADGTLYGSTGAGGAGGLGTIFRYDPVAGAARVIHSFTGGAADGNYPSSRLRVGNDGNLYGVTFYGGYFDLGTFFRLTPAGVLTVLHSFAGGTDGRSPSRISRLFCFQCPGARMHSSRLRVSTCGGYASSRAARVEAGLRSDSDGASACRALPTNDH